MDVTCERCGTEYEFDETLVSDRGTTVKCTNCGHLFKVFRPEADGGAKSWHVEAADGTSHTLGSLKELQRLIADGALTPDDRISRGGQDWKRLGDIAELATFFEAAATSIVDTDPAPKGRARTETAPGPGAVRGERAHARSPDGHASRSRDHARTLDGVAAPPHAEPPRRSKKTMMGVGSATPVPAADAPRGEPAHSEPAHSEPARGERAAPPRRAAPPPRPVSSRPPPPPRPPPHEPPRPAVDPAATAPAKPSPRPAAPAQAARPAAISEPPEPPDERPSEPQRPSNRPLYLDDQEPVVPARSKSRSGLWVALVVLLAAGVAVALGWRQIAPQLGLAEAEDPARPHVEAGDRALAQDHVSGYESAVHHYTQALAYDEHDHRVLTSLARAQSLWAQTLAFDASDLDARADEDPTRRGEANAIRREVHRRAESALRRAEDAVRHGAGDADGEVALADALRLTGDIARARSRYERALTLRSDPNAEALRVGALLETAEAGGDLSSARTKAEEAVAEDPGMIRARLLLARALLAARDVGAARRQVETVLRRDAQHPAAIFLRDAIEEGRPPAPATVQVPEGDAGVAAPTPTPIPAPTPVQPTPTPVPTPGPAIEPAVSPTGPGEPRRPTEGESGPVPSGRDYSWYIRNGDERLERGDLSRARAFYEAAQAVRPGGSEALTGLGQVALQSGDAVGAASRFRQAAAQGYAEAYIGLGAAYRRSGRREDALGSYERYLERLPSGPRAAHARQQVSELRQQIGAAPEPGGEAPPEREPAPPTPEGTLPAPRDLPGPAPEDLPDVESDPGR